MDKLLMSENKHMSFKKMLKRPEEGGSKLTFI